MDNTEYWEELSEKIIIDSLRTLDEQPNADDLLSFIRRPMDATRAPAKVTKGVTKSEQNCPLDAIFGIVSLRS